MNIWEQVVGRHHQNSDYLTVRIRGIPDLTQNNRWCEAQLDECTRGRHDNETTGINFIVRSALLLGSAVLLESAVYCMGHTVLHALLLLPFLVSPFALPFCSPSLSPSALLFFPLPLSRGQHGFSYGRVQKWHSVTNV